MIKYNKSLPDCYIFDIDGTLALKGDRSPYDTEKTSLSKKNSTKNT